MSSNATHEDKALFILARAIDALATDLHFDKKEDDTWAIRIRVNGILRELEGMSSVEINVISYLIVRHDGSVSGFSTGKALIVYRDCEFSTRLVSMPNQALVIRIFPHRIETRSLESFKLSSEGMTLIQQMLGNIEGVIVVASQTDIGRSDFVSCLLAETAKEGSACMSIENRIDIRIENVRQFQANTENFPEMFRMALRADPDLVAVANPQDNVNVWNSIQDLSSSALVITSVKSSSSYEDLLSLLFRIVAKAPMSRIQLVVLTTEVFDPKDSKRFHLVSVLPVSVELGNLLHRPCPPIREILRIIRQTQIPFSHHAKSLLQVGDCSQSLFDQVMKTEQSDWLEVSASQLEATIDKQWTLATDIPPRAKISIKRASEAGMTNKAIASLMSELSGCALSEKDIEGVLRE